MRLGFTIAAIAVAILSMVAFPKNTPAATNLLIHAESVGSYTPAEMYAATDELLQNSEYNGILDEVWRWIKRLFNRYVDYSVDMVAVTYTTHTADGREIVVSGLCIYPMVTNQNPREVSVPALSMQHPTQVERKYSPSICGLLDPELTVPVGTLIAASGYMVFLADYPGMGTNMDVHPYCHASLANSVRDMIDVGLAYAGSHTNSAYPSWNNELYLMGYSEGGYATMITAKAIQEATNGTSYTINAVAALDGPYSLSDTMRNLMVNAGTNYSAPYFLPYVANGYDSVYAAEYPEYDFTNNVKMTLTNDASFGETLRTMVTDGTNTSDEINAQMMKVVPYEGPSSILTASFVSNLHMTTGVVYEKLADNDGYRSWTPAMPMKIMHNTDDDLVPYGNATNAYIAFEQVEAQQVQLDSFSCVNYPLIYLLEPLIGSIHSATAPFAYIRGFKWIDAVAHPDRGVAHARYYDSDNDLIADMGVYWPAAGMWYSIQSARDDTDQQQWGWSEAVPVSADYDGDGKWDPAVYWPETGEWYIYSSSAGTMLTYSWGWSDTIPVPADYDADGKADPAVYYPALGLWYILPSTGGDYRVYQWGWADTIPVPADYNCDRRTDIAVYWPAGGTWYIYDPEANTTVSQQWGWSETLPLPMHINNDTELDLAAYYPAQGMWYILDTVNDTMISRQWGWSESIPVPGDYDGDGNDDIAVYWPEGGTWYIIRSSDNTMYSQVWGWADTFPVNNQARINRLYFSRP